MNYIKAAAVSPELRVADVAYNTKEILHIVHRRLSDDVRAVLFPELSLTGYTPADLFFTEDLLHASEEALRLIAEETKELDLILVVGLPLRHRNRLFNTAAVLHQGKVLGVVPKQHLPNYNEFYESRWFTAYDKSHGNEIHLKGFGTVPFGPLVFESDAFTFGVEICEDLFAAIPPSASLSLQGAEIVFNLSASNELVGKKEFRRSLVNMTSAKNIGAYVYASSGPNESTTDLVFSGHLLISEYGTLLKENKRFSFESDLLEAFIDVSRIRGERLKNTTFQREAYQASQEALRVRFSQEQKPIKNFDREIDPHPFVPKAESERIERAREILAIQSHGLIKRLKHIGLNKTVLGISGGLDSTLALLVIVKAYQVLNLPLKNIITVTMPGFGTTDRTYQNALSLCRELGTDLREISIVKASLQHFEDIGHDPSVHDATYENVQARERTQILMDIANKEGGIVIGTGDLSELALGWCTYNGDQMSMYSVNGSIPKTLVRYLVKYFYEVEFHGELSRILKDILETPVSPELLPKGDQDELLQKTEDLVGPYELHDFFLYHFMKYGAGVEKILFMAEHAFQEKYDKETIRKWLKVFIRRFHTQQFKRSAMPDGPKVGSISLSPRGDLRMPSDAAYGTFTKHLD